MAEAQGITSGQAFDTIALVTSVGEPGNGGMRDGRERVRGLCSLVDGSKSEDSGMRGLPLSVFADKPNSGEPDLFAASQALVHTTQAALFCIQGKQDTAGVFFL